jgi:RNA polymerase sigma-70 factor (ECF subfamily)
MSEIEQFQEQRPRLFGIAYRMLGSASDAEDVVQDAWVRFSTARPVDLRSPDAYLTTIVTRLCLDRLKSARASREEYVGPWLPEPLVTDAAPGPERSAALAESVTLAFMVLLETLSPEERAVFLLREVFEHDYDEIAAMLDTTAANCRQLFHRAKGRIAERRPRFRDAAQERRPLVGRFVHALAAGDADELRCVLAEDVGFWSDGGGKVLAARRPVFGREAVVTVLVGIRRTGPKSAGVPLEAVSLDVIDINGEPAMVVRIAGHVDSVYTFTVDAGAIAAIRIVRNPDKLRFLERQLTGSPSA